MSDNRCNTVFRNDGGPQCCLPAGHDGHHKYKCASPTCPGRMFPPSAMPHPPNCGEPVDFDDGPGTTEQALRDLVDATRDCLPTRSATKEQRAAFVSAYQQARIVLDRLDGRQ